MGWGGQIKTIGTIHGRRGGSEDSISFVTAEDSCASSSDDRLTMSAALSVSDPGDSGPYGEEFPELGWDNGDGEIE